MQLLSSDETTATLLLTQLELLAIANALAWVKFNLPPGDHHPLLGADIDEVTSIYEDFRQLRETAIDRGLLPL
jgi:hypothetical protein